MDRSKRGRSKKDCSKVDHSKNEQSKLDRSLFDAVVPNPAAVRKPSAVPKPKKRSTSGFQTFVERLEHKMEPEIMEPDMIMVPLGWRPSVFQ